VNKFRICCEQKCVQTLNPPPLSTYDKKMMVCQYKNTFHIFLECYF
jgi:hypothetical protein